MYIQKKDVLLLTTQEVPTEQGHIFSDARHAYIYINFL